MNAIHKPPVIHYPLKAEPLADDDGEMIRLEQQEGIDDAQVIVVHPWQLRAACVQLGVLHADPESERTAARLKRRIRALVERIEHLNDYLHEHSDSEHANLTYEQTYSQATADLAAEFITDFEESRPSEPVQGELL